MASRGGKGKAANAPNREELFNMAVDAAKQGNRPGARVMFRQIVGEDRKNTRAMMWLAKIASTKKERDQWLKKILEINPNHEAAQATLNKIQHGDTSRRNRILLRVGVGAYVLVVLVLAFLVLIATAAG
jgi:hypothetical protein